MSNRLLGLLIVLWLLAVAGWVTDIFDARVEFVEPPRPLITIDPENYECRTPFTIHDPNANIVFIWEPGPGCEGGKIFLGDYYMPETNVPPDLDGFFVVPGPPREESWLK